MADRRAWLSVIPVARAVAALVWSIAQPSEVCISGGDTHTCTDHSQMRLFVGAGGVGLAVLLAAVLGFAFGMRRPVVVIGVSIGLGLVAVATVSQLQAIT